jgi:hypothetical protein
VRGALHLDESKDISARSRTSRPLRAEDRGDHKKRLHCSTDFLVLSLSTGSDTSMKVDHYCRCTGVNLSVAEELNEYRIMYFVRQEKEVEKLVTASSSQKRHD